MDRAKYVLGSRTGNDAEAAMNNDTSPVMVIHYIHCSRLGYYWYRLKNWLFWRVWDHLGKNEVVHLPPCKPTVLTINAAGDLSFGGEFQGEIDSMPIDYKALADYINSCKEWDLTDMRTW